MTKSYSKPKKQKPLFEIKKPLNARVYRAKFRAFESTKYLNVKALKAAKRVTIECGTLELGGYSYTVAAEIKKGMIVSLQPIGCQGCDSKGGKKVKGTALQKTMQAVGRALKKNGTEPPVMPMPVKISARLGFQIPIGPIIIVIFDPDTIFDVCFQIWIGNKLCWWCLFSPSGCIGFGPPEL